MEILRKNWLVITLFLVLLAAVHFDGVSRDHARQKEAHSTCLAIRANREELNNRLDAFTQLRTADLLFVAETRRARANKGGSSYDAHFVRVIDKEVEPRLLAVQPRKLSLPDCDGGKSARLPGTSSPVAIRP